ncbi:hypothetical protein GF359_08220, partial [candidate division WOR-3 bacterium]|nr:hypothetical protein [candidate division WOR-3 bacterium]MBD3365186.1 hypothetical protein [candidate division WOR-3 bacterium]
MFKRVIALLKGVCNWVFAQRVNFLVDGSNKRGVKRMVVRRWVFLVSSILIASFLGVSGYALMSRVKNEVDRQELDRLRTENRLLEKQYAQLSQKLDTIKAEFSLLGRHDIQLRVLANMEVLSEDVQKLGVGGTSKK